MTRSAALAALLALSPLAAAHAQDQAPQSTPDQSAEADAATVVATVNGTEITLGHLIALTAQLPGEYQQLPDELLYQAVLDQIVRQQAVVSQADTALSTASELILENERRSLQANDYLAETAAEQVTEEEVQAEYEESYGDAEPTTEWNASHILVETEEEAQALIDEIEDGADFAEVARRASTGPSGPSGGELGWFEAGMMVAPFEDAVRDLSAEEVSGPVQTQFGWHVIRLNETRTSEAPALEEVRAEIEEALIGEKIEGLVEQAREGAQVEIPETGIAPSAIRDITLLQ